MKAYDPIRTFALPGSAVVDRRVPKTLLLENGAPTTADKRHIREDIEEIRWIAVLKPTTVGVAEFRDAAREYLEIAILKLTFRSLRHARRLTKLIHRAIPYPVLLIARHGETTEISLAHKRWSHSESAKTILDGEISEVSLGNGQPDELTMAFCNALDINQQPRTNLYALYQGWIYTIQALQAARITGKFSIPPSIEKATQRASALQDYRHLKKRITDLKATARKEKQISRQVDINLELKRLRAERNASLARL